MKFNLDIGVLWFGMKHNRFIYEELSLALNNNLVNKKQKKEKRQDIQSLILENHKVVIVVYTYHS